MKKSAGILLYKKEDHQIKFFLVHPGGPFWKNKQVGAWSIPKGEFTEGEDPLAAAKREFKEETGQEINGDFKELSPIKLKSGKVVQAWAVEGEIDVSLIKCETYVEVEWPPCSGKFISIPEVDEGRWFAYKDAEVMINPGQIPFLEEVGNV